jgi:hypothetical protein
VLKSYKKCLRPRRQLDPGPPGAGSRCNGLHLSHDKQPTAAPVATTHTARDSNLDSDNHDMSRHYLHSHTRTIRPSTASPIYLCAYFQRVLRGALALAPRSRRDTATHTARDSNLDSGNHDMPGLPTPAYPNDAPIHGLTDKPLAYFQRISTAPALEFWNPLESSGTGNFAGLLLSL